MADIDLARLRAAMQTLGDRTHCIDLRTDYGEPLEAYRLGMRALVDHGLFGGRDHIARAAAIAAGLAEVFDMWAGERLTLHGKRQAVRAAAAAFSLATAGKAGRPRPEGFGATARHALAGRERKHGSGGD